MNSVEKKLFVVGGNLISNTFLSPGGPVHPILTKEHTLHLYTGPSGASQFFLGLMGKKGAQEIILSPEDKVLFFANTNKDTIPHKLGQDSDEGTVVQFVTSYLLRNGLLKNPDHLIILESESLDNVPLDPPVPIIARKLNGEAYLRALDEKINTLPA